MRLRALTRAAVIFVPLLLVCAGRLHAQRTGSPEGVTQEVNRCLTVIRVAASRRKSTARDREIAERLSVGVRTDAAAAWGKPARHMRRA